MNVIGKLNLDQASKTFFFLINKTSGTEIKYIMNKNENGKKIIKTGAWGRNPKLDILGIFKNLIELLFLKKKK